MATTMSFTEKRAPEVRMPPQNIEAEMSALGSLMLDKDAIFKVADFLAPRDFYKPTHGDIYDAILDLVQKREPIDIVSVTNRLQEKGKLEGVGGSSYLASLVNTVPTASHVAHYASIVRKKRMLRDLIEASQHIAELGYKEEDDVDQIIDEAEQRIFAVARGSIKQEFQAVHTALDEAWQRIEELQKGDGALHGIPTGFPDLDNYLAGLQRSDLIVLAARPSLGKTSLALNICRNIAVDHKRAVALFSLEMSKEQLVDRLLSSEANVDLWRLRTGRLREEENDFSRIRDAMSVLAEAPLYLDDSPSPSVMDIRAKARRFQSERDLGLVMVDYLQLIQGRGNTESRVQEVSEISRSLKAMAKELNVPVLAVSQLSRAVEMRPAGRPKLSDLRESGCLAGDTLIMLADTGELAAIKDLTDKTDIPVYSLNDRTLKLELGTISRVFSSGYKRLFALRTRSGRIIKASGNHPFRTAGGWKRLDELKINQHVALPRKLAPSNPHATLDDRELTLLAHLIGDGCVLSRQPVHYTSADMKNISAVAEAAKRLFGISPRVVAQKNWYHVYLPSPYRLARNRRHPIMAWYAKLGIEPVRSYKKRFPQAVFALPNDKIQLLLHHLWATDGNISWKKSAGRKPAAAIYYATTSSVLAEQIQHLLLRLGISSVMRVASQKNGKYRQGYQIHIQGSEMQTLFCRLVGSYGTRGEIVPALSRALAKIKPNPNTDKTPKEAWPLFINPERIAAGISWRDFSERMHTAYCGSALFEHGLSRSRMTRVAEVLPSPMLSAMAESDIYWDEIVSVVPLGIEEVFDATVPGTHNFVANDFIVHNSIEQDADVVMFIYREDKVRENTDKRNIAEILIEKHRNGPTGKIELYFNEETASFRSIDKHFGEIA